ncbi:hypothetical protein [Rheinheimera sp.]|uniref:hypothetical protein n=1 Tax=Rheinheimera sp. TaxID=1869214 RepID=UPI0027B98B20|nr:hypothetical protein [Rheinheimera sp.]
MSFYAVPWGGFFLFVRIRAGIAAKADKTYVVRLWWHYQRQCLERIGNAGMQNAFKDSIKK